jgi:hypothetical protein
MGGQQNGQKYVDLRQNTFCIQKICWLEAKKLFVSIDKK